MTERGRSASRLRGRAEARLRERARPEAGELGDVQRLVHELQVHQVELELQNEELRASRLEVERALERYTRLFDQAPVGYLVIGPDLVIRQANLTAARLLSVDRAELERGRVDEHLAGADPRHPGRLLAAVFAAPGEARPVSVDLHHGAPEPGGRILRATAVALAPDEPLALLALEDVTEQRRAEAEIREEAQRKDEFLATLSHELRNPLAPIRNGLWLLARAQADGRPHAHALAIVERQVRHLTRMVEDLLDVTRIGRGKLRLDRKALELGELVRCTVEDHRAGFEEKGLRLACLLSGTPCWVEGDETRLSQIVGNLLGNAAKFTPRGGAVEVAVRREGDRAAIVVRDDGVGVAPEVRARIFEPFSQAPQTLERSQGGLGLGLAMVKGLAELHGGSVALGEGGGPGTEFVVRLPIAAAPGAGRPAPAPAPPAARRILVIDDSEDGADSLREVLELFGHEVLVARDGAAGLALAHANRPEVVICDIGLPGMNGYDVARALRADAEVRGARLIALTGYATAKDAELAADAGFDSHLAKPPALEALERLVEAGPRRH